MKRTFFAVNPAQARPMFESEGALWMHVKAMTIAGHKCEIVVREATRNGEQNAKLHAMFSDIARQKEWCGSMLPLDVWKRLLTAAWLRARGDSVQMYQAIDGHGVDVIYERTSQLSKKDCAELIEYVTAWAVGNGVVLNDGVAV